MRGAQTSRRLNIGTPLIPQPLLRKGEGERARSVRVRTYHLYVTAFTASTMSSTLGSAIASKFAA